MTGFIGNLQLIVFLGILYVVAADEMIEIMDEHDETEHHDSDPPVSYTHLTLPTKRIV